MLVEHREVVVGTVGGGHLQQIHDGQLAAGVGECGPCALLQVGDGAGGHDGQRDAVVLT